MYQGQVFGELLLDPLFFSYQLFMNGLERIVFRLELGELRGKLIGRLLKLG